MQGTSADVYVACQRLDGQKIEIIAWCSNDWLLSHLPPGAIVHVLAASDGHATRGVLLEEFVR